MSAQPASQLSSQMFLVCSRSIPHSIVSVVCKHWYLVDFIKFPSSQPHENLVIFLSVFTVNFCCSLFITQGENPSGCLLPFPQTPQWHCQLPVLQWGPQSSHPRMLHGNCKSKFMGEISMHICMSVYLDGGGEEGEREGKTIDTVKCVNLRAILIYILYILS